MELRRKLPGPVAMKVLLVNSNREWMPWPVMPVGLCMVASAAIDAGHDVHVADLILRRKPHVELERMMRRLRPNVVGISIRNIDNCNFEAPHYYLPEIREDLISRVRACLPQALIVIGGSAVNIAPRPVLDLVGADCALAGEGETTLPKLLDALEGNTSLLPSGLHVAHPLRNESVLSKRLAELASARVPETVPNAFGRTLKPPDASRAWAWTRWSDYSRHGTAYPIQTKRGCALTCSYCVYNTLEGSEYRLRAPNSVVDEIEECMRHGVDRFEFVDSTFNIPKPHALAICSELAERKLGARLSTMGLNPLNVDDELVDAMLSAGFDNVMCSAESASDPVLESLGKGYGKAHVIRTAAALRRGQVPAYWFFLFGAPGETMATVHETLDFCAEHIPKHHIALFSTGIRILPNTPLERACRASGWLTPQDDLLGPTWYVAPELDLESLGNTLVSRSLEHSNWMINGETVLSPSKAMMMKVGFRMLGWTGPFWQHLPPLFRLTARLGARGRDLRETWSRVLTTGDVVHRR